jgi:hypothetical protein
MATAPHYQISLTEQERNLLIELLERERQDLPAEIHHTRTTGVREDLRARVAAVDRLLSSLRAVSG